MRFVPFDEIFEDLTSKFYKIKKEDYESVGLYPIVDQGQQFIGGYTNKEKLITKANLPVIIFGDHTKVFKFVDFPFTIGADGVKVLRLRDGRNNALFYFHYIRSLKLVDKGYSRHFKYLKEKKLPVFEYAYQLRIADILSRAESLIAQRKESIRLLDEYLKSTFLEMFGELSVKKYRLNELIEIQSGQVNPSDSPYAEMFHVGGANIESMSGKLQNLKRAKDESLISGKYFFTKDHILYSKIRPNLNKVAIPDFEGICSADIYPLMPDSTRLLKQYLRYVLMSDDFLGYTLKHSDRTNIPKINRHALLGYSISLPSMLLQSQFSMIVEKTEVLKSQCQQSLLEWENLYGSMCKRAFQGEVIFDF